MTAGNDMAVQPLLVELFTAGRAVIAETIPGFDFAPTEKRFAPRTDDETGLRWL